MGKELDDLGKMDKDEGLNRVTSGDIAILNSVVDCIREIESALEVKRNEIENKKTYTRLDLATMDLAVVRIKETTIVLKHQRDEMEERLKSHSIESYDKPLVLLKGMNIQDF
jgi:phage terminase large subunit-like protein